MSNEGWRKFDDEPLGDGRSWSATYDSYDQYHDVIYFLVTVDGGNPFMVVVDLAWAANNNNWNGQEFIEHLRQDLARVAVKGETNTDHTR